MRAAYRGWFGSVEGSGYICVGSRRFLFLFFRPREWIVRICVGS
jgi:hypothetical protein